MNYFKTKYRVVSDDFLGYEAQYRPWFLPFWRQLNGINTHPTFERALEMCKAFKRNTQNKKTIAVLED